HSHSELGAASGSHRRPFAPEDLVEEATAVRASGAIRQRQATRRRCQRNSVVGVTRKQRPQLVRSEETSRERRFSTLTGLPSYRERGRPLPELTQILYPFCTHLN